MKPAVFLCAAALTLLTACGGEAASFSAPLREEGPTPSREPTSFSPSLPAWKTEPLSCGLTPDQLPQQLTDSPVEIWSGNPVYLLAQLPGEDMALYGLYFEDKTEAILLDGDNLTAFDLPWLTPRCILPELYSGDFDGDGDREVLLLTYTGSGTGVSSWTLTLLEMGAEGWEGLTLSDLAWDDALSPLFSLERQGEDEVLLSLGDTAVPLFLPDHIAPEDTLEAYAGTILSHEVEDNTITAVLDVGFTQNGSGYTLNYFAELKGRLAYDGEGFSFQEPRLSPLEE